MVKTSKIIATLGVAAGLGIALLPLASYAANDSEIVSVDVSSWIEVDATNNAASEESIDPITGGAKVTMAKGSQNDKLVHTVNVQGNYSKGYILTAHATGANLVGSGSESNTIVPFGSTQSSLPTAGTIDANEAATPTYGWGYRWKTDETNATYGNYQAVSADSSNPDAIRTEASQTYRTSVFNDNTYVNYGIVTATDQPADVYSQTVTYTVTGTSF